MSPLALYIHWPFCLSKCPYCDFNSHVRDRVDEKVWTQALCRELDHYRHLSGPRRVASIFFGGGTPSLMAPETVAAVLDRITRNWALDPQAEITLEANPTSVEAHKFKAFAAAGINRLSLGVQALNDPDLKALGREHSTVEAQRALDVAEAHFPRFSFDLIYARMGQSLAAWETELTAALDRAGGHLSLYQLTLEQGTAFYQAHAKGRLTVPDESLAADMYDITQSLCAASGLSAYEISNHARPGEESRHNLAYWTYGDYAGIGPGAHGRLMVDGAVYAFSQDRSPEKWLTNVTKFGHATAEKERLAPDVMAEEMVMMGLRLSAGIAEKSFLARTGKNFDILIDTAAGRLLFDLGYLEKTASHLRLTPRGRPLLNSVVAQLVT